ncbi:MAG: AMP-binding protein, partial [Thermoguttaceae bacterium]
MTTLQSTGGENVAEMILRAGHPDAPALCIVDRTVTYQELRAATSAWASFLLQQGLSKGDRVGLLAENSFFFVAAYLGIMRAGLCVVPFAVDCSESTVRRIALSTGMKLLLISSRFRARLEKAAKDLGIALADQTLELPAPKPSQPSYPSIDPHRDLAAIMLTSGSTGESKGVMVTHQNIASNTRDIVEYLGLSPSDRVMTVLPFYYCYGASLLHTHLSVGASLVLNNRFMFPEKILDEMAEKECTGLAGVPSTYQILLRKTRFAQRSFPALRWMQQAGGKLPNPFIQEIRQAFPQVRLFIMYGQTEATARLSYLPPKRLDDKLGSIGNGLPGSKLEVLKPDGQPVSPGSDEVGEIVAAGENITLGYLDDPDETARFFRDGRLFTGDMARV